MQKRTHFAQQRRRPSRVPLVKKHGNVPTHVNTRVINRDVHKNNLLSQDFAGIKIGVKTQIICKVSVHIGALNARFAPAVREPPMMRCGMSAFYCPPPLPQKAKKHTVVLF